MSKEDLNTDMTPLDDDTPPVFKNWSQVYLFVLALHALIILAFYIFTKIYS